ncbi:MAG: DNA alkylation repair protein, partial [Oscillospiraceae bacterium]
NIHNGDYYAEMAIAWAISLFYKKFPSAVSDYLTTSNVSDFVFKKALQKIIELKNVPENNKKQLKQLKRG